MAPVFKHPLDDIDAEEIKQAVAAVKGYVSGEPTLAVLMERIRWNVVALQEPSKKAVLAYEASPSPDTLPPRQAMVILHTPPEPGVFEVVVRLEAGAVGSADQVVSWTKVEGVNAMATPDDCLEAEQVVKADPQVRALLEELYGITDLDMVACDPWSVHADPIGPPARCIQAFMYARTSPDDNAYAHPLDMVPMVDMNTRKIVRIDRPLTKDSKSKAQSGALLGEDGRVQWNKENNNYHKSLAGEEAGGWRQPPKPLTVVQPQGPSFEVQGNLVTWQNWSFRLGYNYREGIVLHLLKYQDGPTLRPVAHRLSLVEMAVPYADPREPFVRKCAYDVGDYGLGYCASSLGLGCDCLGTIRYFDAAWVNSKGEPVHLNKAVCMHEEDHGLLWKHVDYRTGHSESRRSRRLVISTISTVVNYEYAFYFYLYQDGTVALDIKLTGELSTNMLSPGDEATCGMPEYGTLVGPGLNAQHHQHMFCARLDLSVDDAQGGRDCVVTEVNVEALPYDEVTNPYGNGFKATEDALTSVHQAQRVIAPEKGRVWKVTNPQVVNPVSKRPVAYKLVPMAHPPLLAQPNSISGRKGTFATKQLWVTPHSDVQRYPAGEYVFNATQCTGLSQWTKEDASLEGADPVLWYSFGATHIVRVEDFPIMPVEVCGFSLKPCGFFTKNPSTHLPPDYDAASKEVASKCCGNGASNGHHVNGNGTAASVAAATADPPVTANPPAINGH